MCVTDKVCAILIVSENAETDPTVNHTRIAGKILKMPLIKTYD